MEKFIPEEIESLYNLIKILLDEPEIVNALMQ